MGFSKAGLSPGRAWRPVWRQTTPLQPISVPSPLGCVSESKFAALADAIRHPCRKASAALHCLDLRQHHLIIVFGKGY